MKKKFYLSLFSLLFMGSILTAQNFQMKKWVLNNQTVDLSVEPPVVVQGLLGAFNSQDNLGGGIYSSNGDLLFHVSPDASSNSRLNVVNKYGTNMGTIEGLTSAFGGELCIVPVPQSNCKFHLIYLSEALFLPTCPVGTGQRAHTFYSTVDMTLNNNLGGLLNQDIEIEGCNHVFGGVLAVGPLQSNGTKRYLYKVGFNPSNWVVMKFEINSTGISSPTIIYTHPTGNMTAAEADLSLDGSMLCFANNYTGNTNTDAVIVHLNPVTGNLNTNAGNNGVSIFNIGTSNNNFTGVEFSPNSNNLFVGQSGVGIHKIEITSNTNSRILGTDNYGNSHLELAYWPDNNSPGYVIYATDGTRLGRIDDPDISPNFSASILQGLRPYYGANWVSGIVYQLPDQIDGYNYDDAFSNVNATCCAALGSYTAFNFLANNNGTWQNGQNPFNNTNTSVKIQNELRIPSGKDVIIQGMTFEFAAGAKVVIEKGARLTLNNSTFTSTGCEALWQGIEVQGDVNESQLTTNPNGLRRQGHLIIQNNSLIENAKEAITLWQQGNLATAGGIVWATNSTFRNNWRSAEFISYQNYTPIVNSPSANISNFKDCVFETTLDLLNNGQTPLAFVTLWALDGVRFNGNIFRNTGPQSDITKRGFGIKSIDAKYSVEGYCTAVLPYGTPCPPSNLVPNRFEGLYYGIDASASNAMNTITVKNNLFTANLRGILLRGIDFATITENSFNIGSTYSNAQSYGLYTDNCSGYKIEGNNFYSSFGGTIGTYTWLSGSVPNRIYRNTFSSVMVGSAASKNNGQDILHGPGLEYRCNNYNCPIIDIGVFSGTIAQDQGYCHIGGSDPAGNTFTQSNLFNLYKNANSNRFYYFFHSNGGAYEPIRISPFIATVDNNCNAFNINNDCKSTLYPNPRDIKVTKQELVILNQQQKNMIDAGNTAALINSLQTLSAGQAKNALISASPYLSDAVLLAYLQTNPPAGHINQVIAANSPVSVEVWAALNQMNISAGIINQLNSRQTGISARTELENTIAYTEKEIWLLNDELIRFYLNDTIVTNPMDSVIAILKEENRKKMKCQQLSAEIKAGKLTDAESTIDTIKAANGGFITDNYCKVLNVILELEKLNQSCIDMDVDNETVVRDVASEETKRGCAHAKALLDVAFSEYFPETIEWFDLNSARMADEGNHSFENVMDKESAFNTVQANSNLENLSIYKIYPNPFTEKLFIDSDLSDKNAEIIFYDIMGLELVRNPLSGNSLELEGKNLKNGILIYRIISDGVTLQNGKLLHIK